MPLSFFHPLEQGYELDVLGVFAEGRKASFFLSAFSYHAGAPDKRQFLFVCLFVLLFRATPAAYGSSQARGRIGATTAGLPTATAMQDLNPICDLTTAHSNAGSLTH